MANHGPAPDVRLDNSSYGYSTVAGDVARMGFLESHLPPSVWYYLTTEAGERLGDVVGNKMPASLRVAIDIARFPLAMDTTNDREGKSDG